MYNDYNTEYREESLQEYQPIADEDVIIEYDSIENNIQACTNLMEVTNGVMQNLGNASQQIANIYAMSCRIKQIKAQTDVQLAKTIAKYKVCHEFLESTFGERHEALQKHYDVLDNAVASGDRDLILAALHGISDIVTTSPLSELQRLAEVFDDPSVRLLDF